MCYSDSLVALLLERFLNLIQLRSVTNRRLELRSLDSIGLKAIGKRVRKVTRVEDEDFVAGLDKVGCYLVPA